MQHEGLREGLWNWLSKDKLVLKIWIYMWPNLTKAKYLQGILKKIEHRTWMIANIFILKKNSTNRRRCTKLNKTQTLASNINAACEEMQLQTLSKCDENKTQCSFTRPSYSNKSHCETIPSLLFPSPVITFCDTK